MANEQSQLWQNSERLFRHAIAVTDRNFMAHQGLGEELLKRGELSAAKPEFETALSYNPRLTSARNNLGVLLSGEGRYAEAITNLQQVLRERPGFAMAHFNLGEAYQRAGQTAAALAEYRQFVQAKPNDLEARIKILDCLTQLSQSAELEAELARLQQDFPKEPQAFAMAAEKLRSLGQLAAAVTCYDRGLESNPDSPELHNNLAWILATTPDAAIRNGPRAVALAERACTLTQNRYPLFLGTLAAAYAEAGRFGDAISTAQKAIDLATAANQPEIAARNQQLLELYRAGKPYHEPAQ